jgi:hypothetical protein
MPYDEPDAEDPMALGATEVPVSREGLEDTARCVVDEFFRMGMGRSELLRLFLTRAYTMTDGLYRVLGRKRIEQIIDDVLAQYPTSAAADARGETI